jgi:methionyl-tRNA formyltransferase
MTQPLRLAFMGTPDFSVPVLTALIDAGHDVAAVYCQPPRAAGRGQKERLSPVHAAAEDRGIEVRTPVNFKSEDDVAAFTALELDVAVVAAYGLILPAAILDAPKMGCLNVHASLLPRWRGAAPIQRAILAGDGETGVTIMQMDEGLDTGDMLLKESLPISSDTTAGSLHDALSEMGAGLIVEALAGLSAGEITPIPQPEDGVTYAQKIDKAESRIDWANSAAEIDRQIRAFAPWPGAWFEHEKTRIKILAATPISSSGKPGALLDDALTVACGEGAISISRLQRAGKGPMTAGEFLKGYDLPAGTVLA